MGTINSRRDKIEWLKHAILTFFNKRPQGSISFEKLCAEFALQQASTSRTAIEILRNLEKVNFIKIKGDEITK